MARLSEKIITLEEMVSRAAVDLETAQAKIDKLTTELNEQAAARAAAEQAAEVLGVANSQLQTRIDELLTELNTQVANAQAVYATQTAALAKQTEATHEAEKRAIAAEITAASLNVQVHELMATMEQLRTLTNAFGPLDAKIKTI
jgi:chromosome segregation ATPase